MAAKKFTLPITMRSNVTANATPANEDDERLVPIGRAAKRARVKAAMAHYSKQRQAQAKVLARQAAAARVHAGR